jgi:hypothetical protein
MLISKRTEVEIDIDMDMDELADELSNTEKQELLQLLLGGSPTGNCDYIQRAYEALMANRAPEALCYLESYLHPAGRLPMKKAA